MRISAHSIVLLLYFNEKQRKTSLNLILFNKIVQRRIDPHFFHNRQPFVAYCVFVGIIHANHNFHSRKSTSNKAYKLNLMFAQIWIFFLYKL